MSDNRPSDHRASVPRAVVALEVMRDGKRWTLKVELGEREATTAATAASDDAATGLGFEAAPLTPQVAGQLGVEPGAGVVVTDVRRGSPAERAGLRPGQLIFSVERKPVNDVAALREALDGAADAVLLRVRDGRGTRYVVVER